MNKTSISLLLCAAMMVGDILRKIPLCLGYQKLFPVSVQFTPVPSGKGWRDERPPLTDETMRETIHNIILHGCTHIAAGEFSNGGANLKVFDYAQSLGMKIDFTSNGVQLFKRNDPPKYCVYSPEYLDSVRTRIEPVLGNVKKYLILLLYFPLWMNLSMLIPLHSIFVNR